MVFLLNTVKAKRLFSETEDDTSREVGRILANAIKKHDKPVVIIASSDFSHAGFNYMSMPPTGTRVDAYAKTQDKYAIDEILKMNPKGLIDTIYKKSITMCGYGPVAAMMMAAEELGAGHAALL